MTAEPAVRAWLADGGARREPERIEVLKEKRKSRVYRLVGAGENGTAVVAKRCLASTGRLESTIYGSILPRLSMVSVRMLAFAADEDPSLCWLFLEDVGDVPCLSSLAEQGALLSLWMSSLHVEGAAAAEGTPLPGRGPEHHLRRMATARAEIRSRRVEMALSLDEEESLDLVEARFGFLAARWERIERICDDTPETLVHADLKDRNVRIRRAGAETCLLPVDWELAGWGPLAVDLAKCPDLDLYADRVQRRWPDLTRHRLRRLQDAGRVFRAILALSWEIERLNPGNAPWSIRRLLSYVAAMDGALERIGMPAP